MTIKEVLHRMLWHENPELSSTQMIYKIYASVDGKKVGISYSQSSDEGQYAPEEVAVQNLARRREAAEKAIVRKLMELLGVQE